MNFNQKFRYELSDSEECVHAMPVAGRNMPASKNRRISVSAKRVLAAASTIENSDHLSTDPRQQQTVARLAHQGNADDRNCMLIRAAGPEDHANTVLRNVANHVYERSSCSDYRCSTSDPPARAGLPAASCDPFAPGRAYK